VVIINKEKGRVFEQASGSVLLTQLEKELFKKLKKDYKGMRYDLEEQVIVV
jgi:hypothetical protein